jgi:hypothetical protein
VWNEWCQFTNFVQSKIEGGDKIDEAKPYGGGI